MALETYQISSVRPQDDPGTEPARTPNTAVIEAIEAHHIALAGELGELTVALLDGARSGDYDLARADLVAWFTSELMPHARAEESVLYELGARLEATGLLVTGMLAEHRAVAALVSDLTDANDPFTMIAAAASAQAIFGVHVAKENDLLLPALDAVGTDLVAAHARMAALLGGADEPEELDVRSLPHGGRHEIIFAKLNELAPTKSFVILNDHDPKPLRYQTEALWPDRFAWTYLEAGPRIWRVEISRVG
ncbi:DUF2249 domain-containing protein [Pengzhenrongella sp.]|jgi:uncharacterized protein (DUF2249 family)|uniref:DUF2249 domain-containing protein n=1 Tax=Pengzhenrongella sp. TaxID=2888820 RepID=UPI002F93EB4D